MVRAAIVLVFLHLWPSLAHAEARFALLIGNQAYDRSVGILTNPHNDIAVVGEALSKQGFEVLPPIRDARRSVMLGGVRDLVRRLNAAGARAISFIYYSGHGAAEKDTNLNYLIPVDAKEPGTTMFWDDSLKLDDVLRLLDGARSAAKFIVFDACRNELQLPTKDTTKGLVPVAEQQGMFIAYASAPGRTASDKGDKSGPYAAALAAELAHPGLDHLNLFQNVKEAVLTATGGVQQPWESNGLGRRVYLTGQPRQQAVQEQLSDAAREWSRVDKTSIAELETFLSRHGSSVEADYARARLAPLRQQQADLAQRTADAAKKKADDEVRTKTEERIAKQKAQAAQDDTTAAKKKADGDAAKIAIATPPEQPPAQSIEAVVSGFGFTGMWAEVCNQPASTTNWKRTIVVSAGKVSWSENCGKCNFPPIQYSVLAAKRVGTDRLEMRARRLNPDPRGKFRRAMSSSWRPGSTICARSTAG